MKNTKGSPLRRIKGGPLVFVFIRSLDFHVHVIAHKFTS